MYAGTGLRNTHLDTGIHAYQPHFIQPFLPPRKCWRKLCTDAPNIRFHDLRHTVATLLLSKEIHPKIVQEQLGHASINLTVNKYSHVIKSMRGIAANALEDVVRSYQVCQKYAKHVSIGRTDWTRCNVEPKKSPKCSKKRTAKTYKYRLDSK